jgi:hypothetical protein
LAEPGKPRDIDYRPLEVELVDSRPSPAWLRWVVALIVVAVLAVAAWWVFGRGWTTGWSSLAFWVPPTPTPTATSTATPWIVTATPSQTPTMAPVIPTPTSDLLLLPTPTVPATITPTPVPTAAPEIVPAIAITLTLNQRSWVRVVADGEVVQEGILEEGESRFWNASDSLAVRTGNAGGVDLILNGEDLGPMGEIGQVVERAWVVEQGQVAETTPETPGAPTAATPEAAATAEAVTEIPTPTATASPP